MTTARERADALVADWNVRLYRTDGDNQHLRECADTSASVEGGDGTYGCDTGCEYVRLKAVITCRHRECDTLHYADFGDMASIIYDLEHGADPR